MAEPFVGEIKIFPYTFAPFNWAWCEGQTLTIMQNQVLFAVIGTLYGGDGRSTFKLPNLIGRTPISFGQGPGLSYYAPGQYGGSGEISLNYRQMPIHSHQLKATTNLDESKKSNSPSSTKMMGIATKQLEGRKNYTQKFYGTDTENLVKMADETISIAGARDLHENRQPYLGMNFFIALDGYFPVRS